VQVTRNGQGGLDLNFTNFDGYVNYCRNTLGAGPHFSVGCMPQAVAFDPNSPDSWRMSPADANEWYDVVFRTVWHIAYELGIPGANYNVWTEPHYAYFIGKNRPWPDTIDRFYDFMEVYSVSWYAIKDADPTARVSFPGTATCSEIYEEGWGGMAFGLEDVIRNIAENAPFGIGIDAVSWQDHNWVQYPIYPNAVHDGTFGDGAAHIREVLQQNGLPVDTPQVMSVGWSDDFLEASSRQHVAAHIASNIIEQTAPDGQRYVESAAFFSFDIFQPAYPDEALVSHPGVGGSYEKRQGYAVFQALHDMEGDTYVQTTQTDAPPLKAMATREGATRYIATIVNYMNSSSVMAHVTFTNLPAGWRIAKRTIKRIDGEHSADGNGLEAGFVKRVLVRNRQVTVCLWLPLDSIRQIILEP